MRISILIIVCCFIGLSASSQKILVTEEGAVTELMNRYLAKNKSETSVKGWRIQIITTPDRRKMQNAKETFSSLYPRIKLSWEHVPPYYKAVIGAWKDKFSCDAFLVELKENFPTAIPVIDNVEKADLVN